jgi:predicted DNA-binding antitoxin AbrB/MazE fold protein
MPKSLRAVYANGVLRPLEPVPFRENEVVSLTVGDLPPVPEELLDADFLRHCAALADDRVTIEQVRAALAKIPGSMAEDITAARDDRV